ncbi:MAG: histidine--tRNA ligase [Parcubacteria group bacterium CG2_30_36_38]|nr:MAG: histidine--tRNA ligase [Parcubacteria group bacterium CG2_30_36_38]
MDKIEPKTLKGFRDFLPEEQIARQKMIEIIRKTYENFGFVPLETPALEYSEILLGKGAGETEKLIYRFKDKGGRDISLRYDLTVPLARVMAQYKEIKKPFKRYQISPVWRAENPQKGRYREFYQCDADIVGVNSMLADAEIISLIYETLNNLDIKKFLIRINNRKIISSFLKSLGLNEKENTLTLRVIDKLEKIGEEEVIKELLKIDLDQEKAKKILSFMKTEIKDLDDLKKIEDEYPKITEGVSEMRELFKAVSIFIPDKNKYQIDLSLARGFDYYTSTIFEVYLTDLKNFGSIAGGGRYDRLVGLFSQQDLPAVGFTIGLDRLFAALEESKLIKKQKSTAKILITFLEKELLNDYLKMTKDLRNEGLNVFFYFESVKLGKQLKFAAESEINYALIYGSQEKEKQEIIVRDILKNQQETIKFDELKNYFKI